MSAVQTCSRRLHSQSSSLRVIRGDVGDPSCAKKKCIVPNKYVFRAIEAAFIFPVLQFDRWVTVVDYGIVGSLALKFPTFVASIKFKYRILWIEFPICKTFFRLCTTVMFWKMSITFNYFSILRTMKNIQICDCSFRTTIFSFWCFYFSPAVGTVELKEVILNYENLGSSLHLYK